MKELHRRRWLLYNRLSGHHTNSILVSGGAAGHFAELRSAVFLQRFIDLSQCVMQRQIPSILQFYLCFLKASLTCHNASRNGATAFYSLRWRSCHLIFVGLKVAVDAKKVRNNHPEQSPVKAKRAEWIDEAGSNLIDLHPTIKADLQLHLFSLQFTTLKATYVPST